MPFKSPFPDVDIPNVDLWGLMFDRKDRDFSDDKVIYRAVGSDRKYTFADVKAHATTFGEGLRDLWDWQKDDILALYVPNDIDIAPVIYGTFFAGGIVTLANPGYSSDELGFQLKDSGAQALVTTKEFLEKALVAANKVGIANNRVLLLGTEKDETHRVKHWLNIRKIGTTRYRRKKAKPEDLAFLAYSSGTTGLPKGVMLSHRNIVADLVMIKGAVGHWYTPTHDKFLGVLPFFHIYGLTGLVHQMLHRGIEVVVMPAFDMATFLQTIQDCKITVIYVAPPIIVRLARDQIVEKYDLSSIRMITSGAAPLSKDLINTVHKRLNIKINQAYGLSETSPMTHTQPWDEWQTSAGSVGKLFPNMTAKYVLPNGDEVPFPQSRSQSQSQSQPPPPPPPAELHLHGPNIFQGYWKNPSATQSSLTRDGFFRTGDLAIQDEQQNLYITDRAKEVIKYKGFQVAPAELEATLLLLPAVKDVAVVAVWDEELHTEVPRAYVVLGEGGGAMRREEKEEKEEEEKARRIVREVEGRVASHKRLRGGVVFVDEIPKSASGKILRRVLRDRAGRDVPLGVGGRAKL